MQDQQNQQKPLFSQEEETKSPDLVEINKNNPRPVIETMEIPEEKKLSGRISSKHAGWRTPDNTDDKKGSSDNEEKDFTD
jgi:hypothetical protein